MRRSFIIISFDLITNPEHFEIKISKNGLLAQFDRCQPLTNLKLTITTNDNTKIICEIGFRSYSESSKEDKHEHFHKKEDPSHPVEFP